MVVLAQLVSGGGLGLLVGFLLGLSVSQVVGGVVAALAALLGGFLGLSGTQTAGSILAHRRVWIVLRRGRGARPDSARRRASVPMHCPR